MLLFPPHCSGSCFNYTANAFAQLHVALWCPCMAKFDRVGDENGGCYHEQGGYTSKLGSHLQSRPHRRTSMDRMAPNVENFALTRLLTRISRRRESRVSLGANHFYATIRSIADGDRKIIEILRNEMLCKLRVRWSQLCAVLTIIAPGATLLRGYKTVS